MTRDKEKEKKMRNLRNRLNLAIVNGKMKLEQLKSRKEDGAKAIIVEIVLVVVAVALCVIFKDKIGDIVTDFMTKTKTKTDAIWS